MIFAKFTKPKWQHRNPEIRQSAIENLDDPNILNEVAQHDEAAEVRRAAIKKISELKTLNEIAQHDKDPSVRELAEQRFKQLLCGQKENGLALDTRLSWLNNVSEVELIAYVAEHGQEVELRLAALNKIEREGLVGDIAINDPHQEVRLAAVEKLTQKSTLERVFKAIRNRDKRVSRRAREKLDELIEQLERPARIRAECEAICTKLESLQYRLSSETSPLKLITIQADNSKTGQSELAELRRLQERWQAVAAEADSEFQNRFTQAEQVILAAFDNYHQAQETARRREQTLAPLRTAKQTLCEQMEGLLIDLKNQQRLGNKEDEAFKQRLQALQSEWIDIPTLEDTTEEQSWQARFERLNQAAQKRYQKLQDCHQIANQLEAIMTEAQGLLNDNQVVKPEQLKLLQMRWNDVTQPDRTLALFSELNHRFDTLLKNLQNRSEEQKKQRSQSTQKLKQLLKDMETVLENGELKNAIPLEQQARELLQTLNELPIARYKSLESRLQASTSKIKELRGWQRWGNQLEREKLCQQMESLFNNEVYSPEEQLQMTEEAQTAWKRLGAAGYSQELWERFNQSCQIAYQNYREHLCLQMENLFEGDEEIHPEEAARRIRQAQTTWKKLGSQGNSQELWERFNQACQTAYEPCQAHFNIQAQERQNNLSEKQELCERLEAFIQETDWEAELDWKEIYHFVTEIEKTWRNIGTTDRKYKKTIQQRFQTAMQVVQTHLDGERQRNCRYRLRLIGQVDEVAGNLKNFLAIQENTEEQDEAATKKRVEIKINEAIEEVKKLQAQWQVTVPGTRSAEREFWKAFRKACDVVFDYRKQQQEALKKELQTYLESKVALCEQVEALISSESEVIKTAPGQVKKLKEEWKKIKSHWNKTGVATQNKKIKATEAVEDRFDKACKQVEMRYQAQLITERREQLDQLKFKVAFCVELEQAGSNIQELVQEEPDWLSITQTAWAELPKLEDADLEAAMEQRFQQACAVVLTDDEPDVSEETLKNKETLCIRMEILAGIESPPEATEARMAYQVARLSEAMSGGERKTVDKQTEAEEIERNWYLSGIVAPEQTRSLEQRFNNAWQAFYSWHK